MLKKEALDIVWHTTILCGRLISINVKDLKNSKNNKLYSFIRIFFAKAEALLLFDKTYYFNYQKEENILLELVNNMLIY